jgi:hypothetical protein
MKLREITLSLGDQISLKKSATMNEGLYAVIRQRFFRGAGAITTAPVAERTGAVEIHTPRMTRNISVAGNVLIVRSESSTNDRQTTFYGIIP